MNFYTVRDLRTSSKSIWDSLEGDGEVVITNNGKPSALMLDISQGDFEDSLRAVRQARAMIAINNMHKAAADAGLDTMTLEEINAEISAARAAREQ
ncbi:MAG: type II toxin-antitoxin system Phd/YefM family antitoxin [Clostridia bacterium]|nr:type II toxin-antitoxin system Phd/YefM family antitoxin [Clostridia bacterium]